VTGQPGPAVTGQARSTVLRIAVADDQATVREGLVALLGLLPDIDVIGSAADGEQAIRLVATERPDAILLDLHMPVLDGIQATRRLTEQYPDVAVVVLTTFDDDESILAALQAGARSYLTKDASRADIAAALRSAAAGLSVLDPAVQARLLAAASSRPEPAPGRQAPGRQLPDQLPDGLTRREAEILGLISQGMTNPGIAAELYLSTHTVKSHINRIFAKTGAADRAAAIRYAEDHGIA
jgi:DNA-binding NarL/FixJ family response regulator